MPIFNYTALKNGQEIVNGSIEATSSREARELIRQLDLLPTKLSEQGSMEKQSSAQTLKKEALKKLSTREKIEFTDTLRIMTQTGVPLIEALLFIENNTASKRILYLSTALRHKIIGGLTFANAMARYPDIFDYVYMGLVKAGEESGELDITLDRMVKLLTKQDVMHNKVKSTMMYPVFVVILSFIVILIMLIFVFPAFKDMYTGMGKKLPWITQTCMDTGVFLKTYWYTIPMGLAGIFYSTKFLLKWEPSRKKLDSFILKLPLLKDFIKLSSLANFVSVLNVAYEAGVPIIDCLYLSNLTVNNYTLKEAIQKAARKVQHGSQLSAAMKSTKIMPNILLFMISSGEQSGKLGEMLRKTSDHIDLELDRVIDNLTKLIEPALLLFIGSIVLVLALALYMPLFQAYQNII